MKTIKCGCGEQFELPEWHYDTPDMDNYICPKCGKMNKPQYSDEEKRLLKCLLTDEDGKINL